MRSSPSSLITRPDVFLSILLSGGERSKVRGQPGSKKNRLGLGGGEINPGWDVRGGGVEGEGEEEGEREWRGEREGEGRDERGETHAVTVEPDCSSLTAEIRLLTGSVQAFFST